MDLITFIRNNVSLTDVEINQIDAAFNREQHQKGKILIKPNNKYFKLIFIEYGMIRSFYEKDGKDITFLFIEEGSFIMPLEAIIENKPDPYGWEVLLDCQIRTVRYVEFEKLFDSIPALNSFFRGLLLKWIKFFSDKLFSLQFQTAEQRYQLLAENHPQILLKAPLGDIASYLGITQQTLSVIRAKK